MSVDVFESSVSGQSFKQLQCLKETVGTPDAQDVTFLTCYLHFVGTNDCIYIHTEYIQSLVGTSCYISFFFHLSSQ